MADSLTFREAAKWLENNSEKKISFQIQNKKGFPRTPEV